MSLGADFAQLAEDLSPEDVRRVLSVFESDVRRLVGDLGAAAAAGDAEMFRRVAHGLAGAAGAVGAKALEEASRAQMGRTDLEPAALPAIAGKVDLLADAALAELAAFVAGLDGQSRRG
jgi:HPt (histidine-containing phosphotransfer) domain-containing protein